MDVLNVPPNRITSFAVAHKEGTVAAVIQPIHGFDLESGDYVRIVVDGKSKGTGEITHVEAVPVHDVLDVVHGHDANFPVSDLDHLISYLNDVYLDIHDASSGVNVVILYPAIWGEE